MLQQAEGKGRAKPLHEEIPRFFLLIATVLLIAVFQIMQPRFLSELNLINMLNTLAVTGLISIAAMLGMTPGEMNFAVGAQATLSAAVLGWLMHQLPIPYPLAFLAGILAAVVVGVCSIAITLRFGVSSFVTSLGFSTVATGVIKLLTGNKYFFSNRWDESFTFLGRANVGFLPWSTIVFIIMAVAIWVVMDKTRAGTYIFAAGSNKAACQYVGINTNRIKIFAFVLSSVFAGVGGILGSSQANVVNPTMGDDVMMNCIAAALLSATFLRPGRFSIQGTVVAAVFVVLVQNGIVSIGAPNYSRYIVQGATLLFAVGFIALTRKEGLPAVTLST